MEITLTEIEKELEEIRNKITSFISKEIGVITLPRQFEISSITISYIDCTDLQSISKGEKQFINGKLVFDISTTLGEKNAINF